MLHVLCKNAVLSSETFIQLVKQINIYCHLIVIYRPGLYAHGFVWSPETSLVNIRLYEASGNVTFISVLLPTLHPHPPKWRSGGGVNALQTHRSS
jgi:hypothetical protein